MSKGWYVKVETNVIFTVDTNICVVAPDQVKAGIRAQELIERYLDSDGYKDELENTLPWELDMGGMEWSRGSRTAEIDFDTMQSVLVEPDPDFDPEGDEEPMSECCGASLLHYENGLGICADCKEWSGPHEEEEPRSEDHEDPAVVRDLMEAAQCLNEAFYSLPDVHPLREWQESHGIAEVRDQINLCAIYCDQLHRFILGEQGYDGCFDLDFCPQFLDNCVDHETFRPKSEKTQLLYLYFNGATKQEYGVFYG